MQPNLKIIAGCNGSGKSTFSKSYVDTNVIPYNFDQRFMDIYRSMEDSELRDKFAQDQTQKEFITLIEKAFQLKQDFCFETNFTDHPLKWAEKAKEAGYNVELIFFCMNSRELAEKRVLRRMNLFDGHFVPNNTILYKWRAGYKNLNLHYKFFDKVLLVDNSIDNQIPTNIVLLNKLNDGTYNHQLFERPIPEYSKRRFPDIFDLVSRN